MKMHRWVLLSLVLKWCWIMDPSSMVKEEGVPIVVETMAAVVVVVTTTIPRSEGGHVENTMVEEEDLRVHHQLVLTGGWFVHLLDSSQRTPRRHCQQNHHPRCHATLPLIRNLILERIPLCTNEIMIGNIRSNHHFSPRRNHVI